MIGISYLKRFSLLQNINFTVDRLINNQKHITHVTISGFGYMDNTYSYNSLMGFFILEGCEFDDDK